MPGRVLDVSFVPVKFLFLHTEVLRREHYREGLGCLARHSAAAHASLQTVQSEVTKSLPSQLPRELRTT